MLTALASVINLAAVSIERSVNWGFSIIIIRQKQVNFPPKEITIFGRHIIEKDVFDILILIDVSYFIIERRDIIDSLVYLVKYSHNIVKYTKLCIDYRIIYSKSCSDRSEINLFKTVQTLYVYSMFVHYQLR